MKFFSKIFVKLSVQRKWVESTFHISSLLNVIGYYINFLLQLNYLMSPKIHAKTKFYDLINQGFYFIYIICIIGCESYNNLWSVSYDEKYGRLVREIQM